jgi:fibronectin-binding autotransporter adhesin
VNATTAVTGSYTLNGNVVFGTGNLSVSGGTASLTVGGHSLQAVTLTLGSGGSFVMTDPSDIVTIAGNFVAGGGDHSGKLTNGQLIVGGNFTQSSAGSPLSFAASGTHLTTLIGPSATVSFQTPGAAASRFSFFTTTSGAQVTLASRVVATNTVVLGGRVVLAGHTFESQGLFSVAGPSALVQMTNPLDSLIAASNVLFDGDSSLGSMSAGVLVVGGAFTQLASASPDAFHPSGTHKTVLSSTLASVNFTTPGEVPGSSHFQELEWRGGGLNLLSDVYAHGTLTVSAAGASTITSTDKLLKAGGLVSNVPLEFAGGRLELFQPTGGPLALQDLTFSGSATTGTQLTITHNGAGGPFTLANPVFGTVPTTGLYLQADDPDGATNGALTLNVVNPTPNTPGGFVLAQGGAVVNWPATAPAATWTGAVNSNWSTAGNWSTGSVPTATTDVLIPAGLGTYPVLSTGVFARDLTVATGASLTQGNQSITVSGNLDLSGTVTGASVVIMNGTGVTARGTVPGVLSVQGPGPVTVTGPLTAVSQLNVTGGDFIVAGHTVTTGSFNTTGTGTITMTNPLDTLHVTTGSATFRGGNSTGKFTAGAVRLSGGGFDSQLGTFAFASTGTALIFDGSANQSVANNVGGNSFADIIVNKSGGNFIWAGGAPITGVLQVLSPTAVTGAQTIQARRVITAAGSSLAMSGLTIDSDSLTVGGSYAVTTTTFNGGAFIPALAYVGLSLNSDSIITAAGSFSTTQFLSVNGFTDFVLGGHTVTVGADFALGGLASLLTMTNPLDTLIVLGNANFSGGNLTGRLTAGALRLTGNFLMGSASGFVSGGTRLVFEQSATQTFGLANTGAVFQDVELAKAGGAVNLGGTTLTVSGQLSTAAGSTNIITGTGGSLVATSVNVDGLTLDNVPLTIGNGSLTRFDNVTFQNHAATATQLTVTNNGAGGPATFTNLSFGTVPSTGLYLQATDPDASANGTLTLNLVNPTPATPGGFVATAGGATVNWPGTAPGKTWTGAVDNNWFDPGNWNPAGAPTSADDVTIPAGPANQPHLNGLGQVRAFTLQGGASLLLGNSGTLQVNGNYAADGTVTDTSGFTRQVVLLGATPATVRGNATHLSVGGPRTVTGPIVTLGGLDIAGGTLTLAGNPVSVGGSFAVQLTNSGLIMTNPSDILTVTGNVTFAGPDQTGRLTDGVIQVQGNFTQSGSLSSQAFVSTGTQVVLFGGGNHTISFAQPGPTQSRFANLLILKASGTITLQSDVTATGSLMQLASPITIDGAFGTTRTLSVAGVEVNGFTLDNVLLQVGNGPLTKLDNVNFVNIPLTATALTLQADGATGPFTINNLNFNYTPTAGGFYLVADDLDGPAPTPLTLNLVNPTPAAPGPFTNAVNGAVINWPAGSPALTWTGAVDSDWDNPANWSTGQVPTSTDDVIIPATANNPQAGTIFTRNLTIQSGASVSAGDHTFHIGGSLDAQGLLGGPGACCTVEMTGSGVTARGNIEDFSLSIMPGASVTLNGNLALVNSSNLAVDGELIIGGHSLIAGQASLLIQGGTGLLTMTHPADVVQVNFVDFAGGDETGRLTAGILATESLAQTGPVATSFVASGSHRVVLGGPAASAISFDNPASARFQDLDLTTVTGTVFLNSDVTVLGTLSATPGGTNGPVVSGGGQFRAVTAGTTAIDAQPGFDALVMDGVNLVISGGATPTFHDVIFQGQNPLATQLTVNNVGLGAPFVFDRLTFNTTPQPGGLYLSVTDLDGPAPTALQVQLVNATPAAPGNFTQAANGASITWNGGQPAVSWTGAVSSDWQVAGNWSTGTVPTFGTDVVIPSGTPNAPVLTTNAAINDLTIQPGATLGLAGFTLVTTGNVDNGGLVTATPGVGGFSLAGAGKLLRGNFDEVTFGIGGTYSLNGRLLVGGATGGNLAISAGGLTLNGHTAEVTGAFATSGVGVVIMQDSQDSLIVRGDALFAGGNTTGALTAGVFRLGGNLAAVGGDPAAFSPQLTHKTFMEAGQPNTPTEVQFADPAASHFANVEFANPFGVSLASRAMATTSGPVTAVVSDGEFSTAGNTFEVGGLFGTTNNGYLRMPLPGDSLIATDATFAGASTDGMLTEGTLVVTNTLVQNAISSITSFAPSGNHKTVVGSGFLGTHLIDIGSPGPGNAGSHFNHLDLSPASTGVTLGVNTPVSGLLIAHDIGNGTPRLASSGSTLQVAGGLDVTALTVDNTPLVVQAGAGAPLQFDGATFQNMDPTVVQFDLSHPGAATAFTFNNLTFATTPSSGQYLSLTDLDGAAPDAFTLNLVNPTPATDGGFSSVSNGAVLNWPATAPGITWTGAASSDWSNPANWSPTVVPTSTSDVVIPSALGTYPVLTAPAFTRNLVVQTGASIDLNGFTLTSSGDVDAGTTISGAGTFAVDGVAKTLRGTVPNLRVTGTTTLSGTTAVTGSLTIDGVNAVLGMGGQAATVAGDLVVQNSGVLVMTSSTDQLTVNGDATFAGGDETGLLIDGVLQVAGDFTQVSATVPTSFVAGGTHRTELIGPGLQVLTFADSTVSGFRDLAIQGTDTTRVHNSMIRVTGNVTVQPGAKLAATNPSFTGNGLAVNGNFSAASTAHLGLGRLYLRGSLSITGPYFITSTIFNGTGQTIPAGPQYRYLYVQGSATSQDGVAVDSALVIQGAGALTLGGRMDVARGIFVENGVLDLAGNTLTSGTLFSTSGGGVLRMQNALDSLIVAGNVFFDGGSTAGQLTAGTIRYGGNFTQTATTSGASFAPSGSHTVVPVNVAGVTVSFATPGTSFFQDLDLGLSDANFQLLTPVTVNGTFAASANGTVVGDGTDALTVNGAPNVTSLLLNNVPLILNGTGAMVFDNVTFQNFDPTLTQLTVNHPGPGAPFQFNNLVFATTPTTGLFLSATDTNVGDSQDLFIEMVNPTPDGAVAGPFVQTGGTASVLWP